MLDTVKTLMRSIGPAGDLLVVNEYAEENLWHLAVDEGCPITAEFDAGRGVLVFSAAVGKTDPKRFETFCRLALKINFSWAQAGGFKLALDPQGSFDASVDVAAAGLNPAQVVAVLRGFDGRVRALREMATRPPGDNSDLLSMMSQFGALRG